MFLAAPWSICILLLASFLAFVGADVIEPQTGHVYATREDRLDLAGVGVRVKKIGPVGVKVYSAAVYLDKPSTIGFLRKLASKSPEESIPTSGVPKQGMLITLHTLTIAYSCSRHSTCSRRECRDDVRGSS